MRLPCASTLPLRPVQHEVVNELSKQVVLYCALSIFTCTNFVDFCVVEYNIPVNMEICYLFAALISVSNLLRQVEATCYFTCNTAVADSFITRDHV